ncbi:MAG TPA: endonuclease domain-containing protein [Thermoanaerobaculia bacterium]
MRASRHAWRIREVRTRVREMRQEPTPAEAFLWEYLRDRKLVGWKFRRQFPVDSYVLDFYCHELKLVVELDGPIHSETRQAAHDENRDAYLRSLGCTVLRFSNETVLRNLASVLERIADTAKALTPCLEDLSP